MRLHRRPRHWFSACLIVVLLFTQLITSAYACPTIAASAPAPAAMPEMPGCEGNMPAAMDPDQPQLCQAHCSQDVLTIQSAPSADQPPAPAVLLAVLDWTQTALAPTHRADRPAAVATGAPPPGSPPIYIVLLALRN